VLNKALDYRSSFGDEWIIRRRYGLSKEPRG
jgi:hypothetical protein